MGIEEWGRKLQGRQHSRTFSVRLRGCHIKGNNKLACTAEKKRLRVIHVSFCYDKQQTTYHEVTSLLAKI